MLFKMLQVAERTKNLVFSVLPDCTGIEEYKLCLLLIVSKTKSDVSKLSFDLFAVTNVLLSTERMHIRKRRFPEPLGKQS